MQSKKHKPMRKKPEPKASANPRERLKPVSLRPLEFEDAMKRLTKGWA